MRIVWGLGMMWWMSAYWIALGAQSERTSCKGFRVRFVECDSDPSEDAWLPFAEANQLSATDEHDLDRPQTES